MVCGTLCVVLVRGLCMVRGAWYGGEVRGVPASVIVEGLDVTSVLVEHEALTRLVDGGRDEGRARTPAEASRDRVSLRGVPRHRAGVVVTILLRPS